LFSRFLALFLVLGLAGCDGLFTGEHVTRFALQPVAGGGYAPIRLSLGPEMNPVALNFSAEYTVNPAEAGQWNSYVATLSRNGRAIATGAFSINNNTTPDAPAGAPSVSQTMMVVDAPETGDYDLSIVVSGPVRVTLAKPNVELRSKVQRPGAAN
jgi:hypothetical protein